MARGRLPQVPQSPHAVAGQMWTKHRPLLIY